MNSNPQISIALCTYNGEAFLSEQLNSFSAQTRLPDELVVCDDGSTDDTMTLLADYAANAPFPVSIHRNPVNLGSNQNFGKAISLCQGDIVFLSDQDDVWRPDKVARMVAEFGRNPAAGFAFSNATLVDAAREPLGHRLWESVRFRLTTDATAETVDLFPRLTYEYVVTGATMALRREYSAAILPIGQGWVHDGWIAYIVSALANAVAIDEDLIEYRQHPRQQIGVLPVRTILGYKLSPTFSRVVGIAYEMLCGSPAATINTDITNAIVRYKAALTRLQMIDSSRSVESGKADEGAGLHHHGRVSPDALAQLRDHLTHLEARQQIRICGSRSSRTRAAIEELRRGGYHRSGLWWLSFGRDIVGL